MLAQLVARGFGRISGTEPPALFRTLARHRRLFWGWLPFAGSMMPMGRLARRESELVILRVAALEGSDYELAQHRQIARRSAGLSAAEVAAAEAGPEGWTGRERLVLEVTDALHRDGDLDDDTWRRLRSELDEREAVELVVLVGHYTMLATTLRVLRVQPDRPRS